MLVQAVKDLPLLPPDKTIVLDVETTSFNDKEAALRPYHGHRVCGVAFCLLDDPEHAWYIPMRHHTGDSSENMLLEPAIEYVKSLLSTGRSWVNQNIKFDAHFLAQDNVFTVGKMLDLQVIARLVRNDLQEYSLDYQAEHFLKERKSKAAEVYLKSLGKNMRDYGRIPASVLGRYAEIDAQLTARLMSRYQTELPDFSKNLWESIEVPLTKVLFASEHQGVNMDVLSSKEAKKRCLYKMIELNQRCNELAGEEMDPGSETDQTRVLIGKFGIEPLSYTPKKHDPQWSQITLETLSAKYPICGLIAEFKRVDHFMSTYIDGWLSRVDDQGFMHPDFRQSGTITGRLSCSNPNMQSVPVEAEGFIVVPSDRILIGWDWSQVEYRFFGHYANDPVICTAYQNDASTDFHQLLADMLGVERQFAKQLNFSFLYGMGKKLLLANITGILSLAGDTSEMRDTMLRNFTTSGGQRVARQLVNMPSDEQNRMLAENIYSEYHRRFPTIRELNNRVAQVLRARGWLKNFYGRRYWLSSKESYRGVNYLVQGSVADYLKDRTVIVADELHSKFDARLLVNVHDMLLYSVPFEAGFEFYVATKKILEDSKLRVPIIVEGRVAKHAWSQLVKINPYERDPDKVREAFNASLAKSTLIGQREWGVFKTSEELAGTIDKMKRSKGGSHTEFRKMVTK